MGTAGVIIGISLDGGATNAYTRNMNTATTVTTGSAFTTYTGLSLSFTAATTTLNAISTRLRLRQRTRTRRYNRLSQRLSKSSPKFSRIFSSPA